MSRVMIISRFFPSYHPRKGEPTYFVEKIWKGFMDETMGLPKPFHNYVDNYTKLLNAIKPIDLMAKYWEVEPKYHTIRAGNRWKVGDKFSPRVWSGKPYASKQITIAPDIEIKKIFEFECKADGTFYINNKWIDVTSSDIPENDGLSSDNFLNWFPENKPFSGQIICWNENINY